MEAGKVTLLLNREVEIFWKEEIVKIKIGNLSLTFEVGFKKWNDKWDMYCEDLDLAVESTNDNIESAKKEFSDVLEILILNWIEKGRLLDVLKYYNIDLKVK